MCVVMNITINRTGVDKILYREWTTLSHDNVTSLRRLIFTYSHNVIDRSLLRTPVVNLRWHQNCNKPPDTIYTPGCTQGVNSSRLILVTRSHVLFYSLHRSSRCSLHFLLIFIWKCPFILRVYPLINVLICLKLTQRYSRQTFYRVPTNSWWIL